MTAAGRPVATPPAGSSVQRICFVVSAPMTAEAFLAHHIRALSAHYEVHLVANADPESIRHPGLTGAKRHRARIERSISPLADLAGLAQLIGIFRSGRYSAVHSLTPKAGLLTAVAAWAAGVPVRVHTYTGQVWATRKRSGRWLLKALDRLIAQLDTHLLVDSASQLDFLRSQRVLGSNEGVVLGRGSVSGVDCERFMPDALARDALRRQLSIPPEALVFLFVGRLTRDKGVLDLAAAFREVAAECSNVYLVVVGPDEEAMGAALREVCGEYAARVRLEGYCAEPERYMAASDVFCLPSYREGFGAVIVEAAATGIPAIGSRIYGITDAIEDRSTGLLVDVRDIRGLAAAMRELAGNEKLRLGFAAAARTRALRDFSSDALSAELVEFYRRVLAHKPACGASA